MLNVRTTQLDATPDLGSPARIRDAAVVHFARDGFSGANLRAIAATAGVSAGLVIHHFGSKAGLQDACDDYVLQSVLGRARDESTVAGLSDAIRNYLANPMELQLQLDYLARAITEDTPTSRRFVDALVDETEGIVRDGIADGSMSPSSDPRALAVIIAMTSIATLTLSSHFARTLGFETFGPDLMRRVAVPSLELYTNGLYADNRFLDATRAAIAPAETDTD
jgi:AcrR family transcriptional regulator